MLPQYAHLAAVPPGNSLLITDRFANLRRIEALVKSLDTPENKPAPRANLNDDLADPAAGGGAGTLRK